MKKSKYNIIVDYNDDEKIYYNTLSGNISVVTQKEHEIITNYVDGKHGISKELLKEFQKCGYIVNDDVDEVNIIEHQLLKVRYNNRSMSITIAPTAACNFRCIYCYQLDVIKNMKMTEEVQDKIVEVILHNAPHLDSLQIMWYGGEPLLAIDIVCSLSKRIIEICKRYDVKYIAHMVTNGYFLNKKNILRLRECEILGYQVTLDGGKKDHDCRRKLIGGKGTYDRIMKNLKEIAKLGEQINVRINVDKANVDGIYEVEKEIRQFDKNQNVNIYLAKVENVNDIYTENKCFTNKEFSIIEEEFKAITGNGKLVTHMPKRMYTFCTADNENSMIVANDGRIYRCWSDFGYINNAVGSILEKNGINQSSINSQLLHDYMLFLPTRDKKCSQCKYLPVCMGGCPMERIRNNTYDCINERVDFENQLLEIVRTFDEEEKITSERRVCN